MMLLTTVTRSIGTWYPVLGVPHPQEGRKDTRTHTGYTVHTHVLLHTCHVLHVFNL